MLGPLESLPWRLFLGFGSGCPISGLCSLTERHLGPGVIAEPLIEAELTAEGWNKSWQHGQRGRQETAVKEHHIHGLRQELGVIAGTRLLLGSCDSTENCLLSRLRLGWSCSVGLSEPPCSQACLGAFQHSPLSQLSTCFGATVGLWPPSPALLLPALPADTQVQGQTLPNF